MFGKWWLLGGVGVGWVGEEESGFPDLKSENLKSQMYVKTSKWAGQR